MEISRNIPDKALAIVQRSSNTSEILTRCVHRWSHRDFESATIEILMSRRCRSRRISELELANLRIVKPYTEELEVLSEFLPRLPVPSGRVDMFNATTGVHSGAPWLPHKYLSCRRCV